VTTLPATDRADALNLSTDLAQAGAVFNDSTRLLDGGLWSTPADNNNQQAYLGMYTTDINAVLDDVNAALANPAGITVSGNAFTPSAADTAVLSQVQGQLQTLLNEAPLSVGHSQSAANAQELIHTTQTSILNEINGDSALAQALGANPYATDTGATNVGFQSLPAGTDSAAALSAATASGASLAQIGSVFNAATDLAVGGLNHSNLSEFNSDMQAVATGLSNLINNPTELSAVESGETAQAAALTTVHLDTLLNQTNLQINDFDQKYASNPNIAARSTNDNLLDMIDIVQNDTALNTAAGGNGTPSSVGGFAEMPSYLAGTIQHYQDNQAQTNFWSQFLSEANVINGQLQNVAAGNNATPGQVQSLISEIQNYQQFGASFDQSQGGVFGARFDNELLSGTLLADTTNAVHGLQGIANGDTGAALAADQAQILAAGQGFVADATDVSGNNVPVGGGTYVGTSTTVSGATSPAGIAQGTIPVTGPASGSTGLAAAGGTGTGTGGGSQGEGNAGGAGNQGEGNFGGSGVAHNFFNGLGQQDGGQGLAQNSLSGTEQSGGQSLASNALTSFEQQLLTGQNHFDTIWHHA
jgi:trimeric autotransporter adhesin